MADDSHSARTSWLPKPVSRNLTVLSAAVAVWADNRSRRNWSAVSHESTSCGRDCLPPRTVCYCLLLPLRGILLSGLLLRYFADRPDIHDAEAYLEAYHRGDSDTRFGSFLAKVAAAIATVGFGGAAGLEGPSLYIGSSLGDFVSRRLRRVGLDHEGLKTLLVAGAAAGISAVFKAPLTGLIFALEMPYTDDFAREALIPSMLASVSSYLVAIRDPRT